MHAMNLISVMKWLYRCASRAVAISQSCQSGHGPRANALSERSLAERGRSVLWLVLVAMQLSQATGDEGGPPRLARWLEARKVERERVAALAAAGVSAAVAYEEPALQERMTKVISHEDYTYYDL